MRKSKPAKTTPAKKIATAPHEPRDLVLRPAHYTFSAVEPIDAIEAWAERSIDYHIGAAVKYLARYRRKDAARDLQKTLWYVARAIFVLIGATEFFAWWDRFDATVRNWSANPNGGSRTRERR